MTKIRLNKQHREQLLKAAGRTIQPAAEVAKRDAAYEAAAKLVKAAVEKRFPPKDMKLLQKYEVAAIDRCIGCADLATARVFRFRFRGDDDSAPLAPSRHCSTRSIGLESDAVAACNAYEAAQGELDKAMRAIFNDFRALIHSSTYLEEIVAVWPGAAEVIPHSGSTAVPPKEAVERIKALLAA